MTNSRSNAAKVFQPEPRWPAAVAVVATAMLYLSLPERLTAGPNWLLLVVMCILLAATMAAHRTGNTKLNFQLGLLLSAVMTAAMIWSLGELVAGLPAKREAPTGLLRAASALWLSNILVFASWYWRLDAGGPHSRDLRQSHSEGAFLFPQMTQRPGTNPAARAWKPGFMDYLFLAFNTSTAFSPTDVPVLSRWAKALMMVQSLISLGTIAILAARAINIL
ncbi:MAG: hypothetical protein ACR2IV_03065 [Bryobacteraceae bacterium]